jgi:hypothetical protein
VQEHEVEPAGRGRLALYVARGTSLPAYGTLTRSFEEGSRLPRKSPFRIELSAGESAELSRRATTVEIKALACELPTTLGLPLSRLSVADVAQHAQRSGLVARISDSTVWRWLHEDAIRPWQHRCWFFPRDPHFQAKAGAS